MINASSSTPSVTEFNPKNIPYQLEVLKMLRRKWDYSSGPHSLLLSGSVGSAKSLLMAHIGVTHCLANKGARIMLGRKAMPDLKDTILQKILDHMEGDLVEGVDYVHNETKAKITFANGSEIISRSWHDKKYKKFRSLELSGIILEELTENTNAEKEFFIECMARLGRLPHVKENFLVAATNPDDPSHWVYDFFIKGADPDPQLDYVAHKGDNRHVVYSRTEQNPFLPDWYISSLRDKYPHKVCQRLLEGIWLYISTDVIYFEYDPKKHYVLKDTKPNLALPLRISFDFNIGNGKPQSSVLFQYDPKKAVFTFLDEVVVEGTRTINVMEEWAGKGYFDLMGGNVHRPRYPKIIIHGDASGRHRDTRSINSDYQIIEDYLARYQTKHDRYLDYEIDVPRSNPPIRDRHNIVNGQLRNANGRISIYIDKRCKTLDEGLAKTKLRPGASYVEDDGPANPWQHITTAMGYGVVTCLERSEELEEITLR